MRSALSVIFRWSAIGSSQSLPLFGQELYPRTDLPQGEPASQFIIAQALDAINPDATNGLRRHGVDDVFDEPVRRLERNIFQVQRDEIGALAWRKLTDGEAQG